MKFIYTGDPQDKNDTTKGGTVDGVYFARGEATEAPESVAIKLRKHSHFKEAEAESKPKPVAKKKAAKKVAKPQEAE
jgi:hypothetical protein